MDFTKLQATGNDFILIEAGDLDYDWSRMSIEMCNRHYGIGADGLLLLLPSDVANFQMRVFNADGSQSEACGNGLRCFARYVLDKGLVSFEADQILIETIAGTREVRLNKPDKIQVSMGTPRFGNRDFPVAAESETGAVDIKPTLDFPLIVDGKELLLDFVSMGNPHAVYFYAGELAEFPLSEVGPQVEQHRMFPNRVNFEVARLINRGSIEARVWERGVGETLACGTGAAAIGVMARVRGYIENIVDINLSGGTLHVEWNEEGEVFLSGPAEIVFTGKWKPGVKME
jgi:diaminopimelate epimerase